MSTESSIRFQDLALSAPVLKAIDEVGYEFPSAIQAQSIPPLLEGRDLLGQAQTGTGKTAAFSLPLLSRLDLERPVPQLLVLTPTRELSIQVAEAMQTYARHLRGFHVLPIYGGQNIGVQLRHLRRGVHAVVGTPGRILDHLGRGTLRLDGLSALVLDEADEMLRMGFIDDVEEIIGHAPENRQLALFSATLPAVIKRVAQQHLDAPVEIRVKTRTATVSTVTQRYWLVSGLHKLDALTRILEVEDFDAMIIFVRTRTATTELSERLEARGYASAPLNGEMNQSMREKTVERLKRGSLDVVVATDVAARGLDLTRISHVLNYDIPNDTDSYVHRIGRTGRAGRTGEAILFVAPRERRMLQSIERATRQTISPMQLPSRGDIADRRVAKFKQRLSETLESEELGFFREVITDYQREQALDMDDVAAALAFLAQRERPLMPDETPAARGREFTQSDAREPRPEPHRPPVGPPAKEMVRYRLEVGREHGVQPKHIVGAIANEAGVEGKYIDNIDIHDEFSTVDLPEGMPSELFHHLKTVWVCNRQLALSVLGGGQPVPARKAKSQTGKPRRKKSKPKDRTKSAKPRKSAKSER
jgi:ATP-dependent RNA helicase DeaD